jgi:hypothetical protein
MTAVRSNKGRERQQKILQAILRVASGTTKLCAYEEIVVQAWRMWPEEFGLRGYTDQFPDASDLHKPLYGPLKRAGLVRNQTKRFGLTERGLAVAQQVNSPESANGRRRVQRDQRAELQRVCERSVIDLVLSDRADDLLDTDLYDFYGVTVRTKPADFAGRVKTVDAAIDAAIHAKDPSIELEKVAMVVATREALRARFGELIDSRSTAKEKIRS